MIDFARPDFLWALPLTLVPVVIHLLNRLRYERVRFPATRFLLESRRRYKIRVLLREWLTLLLRVLAVAGLVLLFAQPRVESGSIWGRLPRQARHYVFVLDDTLSMRGRFSAVEERTPWDVAKEAAGELLRLLGESGTPARVTVIRASRVGEEGPPRVDVDAEELAPESLERMVRVIGDFQAGFSGVPLAKAVDFGSRRVEHSPGQATIVVFSDLQLADWQPSPEWQEIVGRLRAASAQVRVIACGLGVVRPNFSLTQLEATGGIVAVGVPVSLRLGVANFSGQVVRNLPVELFLGGEALPPVVIAEVPPFSTAVQECYVVPQTSGDNQIEARLPADTLNADNSRYLALPVKEALQALVVDGDPSGSDATFVELALSPGGVNTGIACRRTYVDLLSREPLRDFDLVCLLNVGRLGQQVVEILEDYVAGGGGLVYFVGERTDPAAFAEELCRDGRGLLPVRLASVREISPSVFLPHGNLVFVEHPGLAGLRDLVGPATQPVFIGRLMPLELWDNGRDEGVSSISGMAKAFLALDDGTPLAFTFSFGEGRCAIVGTTAGPRWNNWARVSPSYVVTLLELARFLCRRHLPVASARVGQPLPIRLRSEEMPLKVRYLAPGAELEGELFLGEGASPQVHLPPAQQPGFGMVRWESEALGRIERVVVANVDPRESDLRPASRSEIVRLLEGVDVAVIEPRGLGGISWRGDTVDLVPLMLVLVAMVLLGEAMAATGKIWSTGTSFTKPAGMIPRAEKTRRLGLERTSTTPGRDVELSPRARGPSESARASDAGGDRTGVTTVGR